MKGKYLLLFLLLVLAGCKKPFDFTLSHEEITLKTGEDITIEVMPNDILNDEISFKSEDEEIAICDEGRIIAKKKGNTKVIVKVRNIEKEIAVTVEDVMPTEIKLQEEEIMLTVGNDAPILYEILPENVTVKDVRYTCLNPDIVSIEGNSIKGISAGDAKVIVTSLADPDISATLNVKVITDVTKPEITFSGDLNPVIDFNQDFDLLAGITATDDVDGDITDKVEIKGNVNSKIIGTYKITYNVKDKSGNVAGELTRIIKVNWPYSLGFIGHAGCYSGLMNSELAFKNAFEKHGYQLVECDLKQTKDGVFVLSHDDAFNDKKLNKTSWNEIKDDMVTLSRGGKKYTAKLCLLSTYLEIVKENNGIAVIELKYSQGINNSDQSRMGALMSEIKKHDMSDKVIFLASQYKCLEWVRNNGYADIPCQYLVNSLINEAVFNRCKENNFDVSFNIEYENNEEWIRRYQDEGIKVSCYTFSQYKTKDDLQKYIDYGVDYVTVDDIKPWEVKIPLPCEVHDACRVTFYDWDMTVLKQKDVPKGKAAVAPINPKRKGYLFAGWDKDFNNIREALDVVATYEIINYNITYDPNKHIYGEVAWKSKAEFTDELYQDWFDWLKGKVGLIPGLAKEGEGYKFTRKDMTAEWSDPAGLKAVDIYQFERTIGAYAYAPVKDRKTPLTPVCPEINNEYFLNTEPYRTKYIGMDRYLIKAIHDRYNTYDYNYNQVSNGRVQIFFRFHQWQKGKDIQEFDDYPKKLEVAFEISEEVSLPSTCLTYTIEDEIILPPASSPSYDFKGWYLDPLLNDKITKIEKGSTGDIRLYAGWIVK